MDNAGYYSPYTYGRDPRNSCGGTRQPGKSLGYSTSRGYQYSVSTTTPVQNNKQYSIKGFFKETLFGGLMGGLSGAAFYGAGKAVDKIKRSVYGVDDYEPLGLIIGDGEELEVANKIAGSNTPKVFKVIGHGNPYGIRQGDRMLNAEELADMIRQSGDYVGGKQKIILFSCSTGREPDGLARQLADILNVEVIAPSTEVRPTKLGIFIACEEQFVEGQSKYVRGKWNIFMPRK